MDPTAAPRPAASIVIPLWNNVAFTHACLVRLAAATPAGSYEVVLVDNGSTDATQDLLATLSGDVRIVRNPRNLGVARACNQGAEVAAGRYLVFLNNDTEPHPGWLEPLVEVFDTEPDVGVVGSKLLFPNGLVQHAGVWMVGDRSGQAFFGLHRLYQSAPDDPIVDQRCDLQAVTGAALAIRRDLFRRIGGFDESYWNGNEDVDLCLKVGGAGYRVVYEPRSCLTHHESVSGPERFSRVDDNVRRLAERWSARSAVDVVVEMPGVFTPATGIGAPAAAGTSDASPRVPAAAVARPARVRPDAVHVIGLVGAGGRPGRTATMAAELLSAAGVDHDVSAYHRTWARDAPPAFSLNGSGPSCGIVLVCAEPDRLAWFRVAQEELFGGNRYVIALWEGPDGTVPDEYGAGAGLAHELWMPTTRLRSELARLGAGNAWVLRPHAPEPFGQGAEVRSVTGTADRLTFTAALDLSAGPNPHETFDDAAVAAAAFARTFGPEDGVALLVGVTGGRHLPWQVQALMDLGAGHPGVAVLDLDPAGLRGVQLAAAGDCHLALSGARGFAPATLAAMQAGVPVVALAHPDNPGPLNGLNSYLLDPATPPGPAERVALAAEVMRRVAADPGDRAARGRRAATDIAGLDDRNRAVRFVSDRVDNATRLLEQLAGVAHA